MAPTARLCALVGTAALAGSPALAGEVRTFLVPIPEIGQEFFFDNGIMPFSNDFDGAVVIDARLDLVLDVVAPDPGDPRESSAAHFLSEVVVPVDTLPGLSGAQLGFFEISGADEGWSGTGTFTISRTLDSLIGGTWVSPVLYTASTYNGIDADHVVLGTVHPFVSSFISITVEQVPAPGSVGAFMGIALIAARRRRS